MPKPKRGTALFDLLTEDAVAAPESLKVPTWWGKRGTRRARERDTIPTEEKRNRSVDDKPESHAPQDGIPVMELDGNRLRISFTSVTAAVAVFAASVVILAAYELGRSSGEKKGFRLGHEVGTAAYAAAAVSEIEAARNQPAASHLLDGLLDEPRGEAAKPDAVSGETRLEPPQSKWLRDYTYVVAQEFAAGNSGDALRVQEFLAQRGVATELVPRANGGCQLITAQGFDRKSPAQRELADQLLKKVQAIGSEYYAAGGGYKLEGYFRTLKGDTW